MELLSDVKVLDLTWYIAGPYCTKLLADYGAEVVKIERPGLGDPARSMGPFPNDEPHLEKSGIFLHLNTNKKGITLNLKSETGKTIFRELVRTADIVVESFTPRVMPSLGLSYEALAEINPKIVMTSVSNFGQIGPYRDFKGSELIFQGFGGPMILSGAIDREPSKKTGNAIQYQLGTTAATATMVAFFGAVGRGQGDHVDASGVREQIADIDGKTSMMTCYQYTGHMHARKELRPLGVRPCKDGYVWITGPGAVTGMMFFAATAKMLGMTPEEIEEWGKPEVLNDPARAGAFDDMFFTPWLLEHDMRDIVEKAQAFGVMAAPCNNTETLLRDPHFRERGYWREIVHPLAGPLTYPGLPFRVEGTEARKKPAPLLGQHTGEVYGSLGYSREDLIRLVQCGVI